MKTINAMPIKRETINQLYIIIARVLAVGVIITVLWIIGDFLFNLLNVVRP